MTKLSALAGKPQSSAAPAYETDFYSWALRQAQLVREGRLAEADLANIAEELADLGRSEYREMRSALARTLQHMLKWDYQPAKRSESWRNSIRIHRIKARHVLGENPGLRGRLDAIVQQAYELGVAYAAEESGMPPEAFPEHCPYDLDAIMSRKVGE